MNGERPLLHTTEQSLLLKLSGFIIEPSMITVYCNEI